jgi:hypothetical protein
VKIAAILIAGMISTPASAMSIYEAQAIKFTDLKDYSLVCEDRGGSRYTLDVAPSSMKVTLTSDKGHFDFPIIKTTVAPESYTNEFGNSYWTPFVFRVEFRDNGGNSRVLLNTKLDLWTTYLGKGFVVHCIPN